MKNIYISLGTSILLLLGGCATNQAQYHWGDYETLVYNIHIKPEEASPQVQIETLRANIAQAELINKPVAPGVYAHLALMYSATGNRALALESLNKEKTLFPESTTFIDGLIQRSVKQGENK